MLVGCPTCRMRYRLDPDKIGANGIKLRCGNCRAIFRIIGRPVLDKSEPAVVEGMDGSARTRVLIAHESPAFCATIRSVLSAEPFDLFFYNDGTAVLAALDELHPDIAVIDVALPGLYGFQLCEHIKSSPEKYRSKIILIASIYDKTKYKREPQSLYCADDYIEKHHIPDELATCIYRLLSGQQPVDGGEKGTVCDDPEGLTISESLTPQQETLQEDLRQELRQDENAATTSPPPATSPELEEAHNRAKRLARIIVSDIALYNQAAVRDGVTNGTFFELLQNDIVEGRSLYEKRIPEEVRRTSSYLDEAFAAFIARMRAELNL